MAFFSERRPSAGVYLTSPVCRRDEQLTMASMGALFLGSPPPRWMTGSPLSLSRAAVSFSFSVGDSQMDLFCFQAEDGIRYFKVTGVQTCALPIFFFFQAEDGIRDYKVTGVQTCALPI